MGGLGEECRNRGQTASTKVLSCEYARRVSGKVRSEEGGRRDHSEGRLQKRPGPYCAHIKDQTSPRSPQASAAFSPATGLGLPGLSPLAFSQTRQMLCAPGTVPWLRLFPPAA